MSRSRSERATSEQPYVTQANSLILPDGPVNEEAAELLEEFVGTHHHEGAGLIGDEADDGEHDEWKDVPWWKRPSPLWLLCMVPFSALAQSSMLAPKVELFTMLACRVHKPDIYDGGLLQASPAQIPETSAASLIASVVLPEVTKFDHLTAPNPCATDPTVQAAVAKLSAAMTTTMGVLSLLTTAWWGALSDRKGRVFVMGVSLIGLLLSDFNYINVYYFSQHLPGGYWFLLLGPVIEGALGGFATAVAAIHAYLADTTTESTRARIFSLNLGLLFVGMALGPTVGSLLIRQTGHIIAIFFMAATIHCVYALFIWVILPESLSRRKMKRSRQLYERETEELAAETEMSRSFPRLLAYRFKLLFRFLRPLTIFFPDFKPSQNPLKKPKRDWNLTLMAVGYGFTISMMALYPFTFQYAAATFSWTSVQLGYFLSIVGAGRAVLLTIILPVIIRLFKPEPLVIEIPQFPTERDPLLSNFENPAGASPRPAKPPLKKELHSPSFELGVARVSLVIEIIAYSLMGLAPSGTTFAISGVMAAMGVGFSPAVQTCTLAMYARRGGTETGRLFGALSVIQALGSQVLGPPIYGLVYMKTVEFFPGAIFFVAVSGMIVSFVLFTFIRLPKDAELRRDIIAAYSSSENTERPVSADSTSGTGVIGDRD
ncbi:hypothetical protein CC2G_005324 [Coprinopsis cinerea AmutBmut pab1-1]|nr:hypothetical protein CC2G_005324 [Coprinopsis cinerea AmutBmut pab1-1]